MQPAGNIDSGTDAEKTLRTWQRSSKTDISEAVVGTTQYPSLFETHSEPQQSPLVDMISPMKQTLVMTAKSEQKSAAESVPTDITVQVDVFQSSAHTAHYRDGITHIRSNGRTAQLVTTVKCGSEHRQPWNIPMYGILPPDRDDAASILAYLSHPLTGHDSCWPC